MTKSFLISVISVVITALLIPSNAAQASDAFDDQWHFQVGVPFWMSSISGNLQTPNFSDIPVSASFSQVISHFIFGAMAHAEARKERFGIGTDLLYSNIGDTLDTGRASPSLQTLNLSLKQVFSEAFLFYRVIEEGNPSNPYVFDLLGGARYYWTQSEINQLSASLGWVDMMLGLRGQIAIGDHLSIRPRSDFAFLGSKFTWNLIGEADWAFSDHWTVSAAYRAMDVDYENNSTQREWDLNYHGPWVGAVFSW